MPDEFCSKCGAELVPKAKFCAACGQTAGTGLRLPGVKLGRFAPLLVFGSTVVVAGAAALIGYYRPVEPPSVPGQSGGRSRGVSAAMPEGHPPIEIPEDVRKAIAEMRARAEAAPDDLQAWLRLAEVQYRAGLIDPALLADADGAYRHVIERDPKNTEVLRSLGNIAFDRDDPAKAIEYYRRYLEEKPDDINVQTDMATMVLSSGGSDEAIRIYEKVLQRQPGFFQALFNLGIAYHMRGDREKAAVFFEKARGAATDDRSRAQADQALAGMKAAPPVPSPVGAAPAGGFRHAVEEMFRSHQMIGPRLVRLDWPSDTTARVLVGAFPIDGMPDDVRARFAGRIREQLREKKTVNGVAGRITVEIVDSEAGTVMETIAE